MPIAINGSGTVTGISVGGLPDGIVDTDMIAAAAVTAPKRGPGAILQVKHAIKQNGFSVSASTGNFSDITDVSVSITVADSNNKVLIHFQSSFSTGGDVNQRGSFRLLRGSTVVNAASADGQSTNQTIFPSIAVQQTSQCMPVAGTYFDDPGAGTHIYKLQVGAESSAGTVLVNAVGSGSTGTTHYKGVTNLVCMEVAV